MYEPAPVRMLMRSAHPLCENTTTSGAGSYHEVAGHLGRQQPCERRVARQLAEEEVSGEKVDASLLFRALLLRFRAIADVCSVRTHAQVSAKQLRHMVGGVQRRCHIVPCMYISHV